MYNLTKEQALFIKDKRKTHTWRAIARDVADKYPDLGINSGNQIDGQDLCECAMRLLGEREKDGWN